MLWKAKYELGVPLIDTQHRELFHRVGVFLQTLRSPSSWEERVKEVNQTLDFMKEYVVEHFRDEEAYQRAIAYPGYENHKRIHDQMVDYVSEVSAEYEKQGYDEKLIQQFAGRLLTWLINHVAAEDQRIAAYAVKKGVSQNDS